MYYGYQWGFSIATLDCKRANNSKPLESSFYSGTATAVKRCNWIFHCTPNGV